jgi:hypothetical protein
LGSREKAGKDDEKNKAAHRRGDCGTRY